MRRVKNKICSKFNDMDAVHVGQILISMFSSDIKLKRSIEVELEPMTALEFFKRGMNCKTTINDEGISHYYSRLHFKNNICDELYIHYRDDTYERIKSYNDLIQILYGFDHIEIEVFPRYYRVPQALLSGYSAYISRVDFIPN